MKPVFQTRFGQDPDGPGNCFSACVASVLECTLAELPDEAEIVGRLKVEHAGKWETWPDRYKWGKSWERLWAETQRECLKRGLWMLEVADPLPYEAAPPEEIWTIISAKSPRGLPHACVGQGRRIVHDPHPEGGGVAEAKRTYIFFVAINPAVDHTCPECPIDAISEVER